MPQTGIWLRVFVALLIAALPPVLFLVGAVLLTGTMLPDADVEIVSLLVVVGATAWWAILAVIYARSLSEDIRSFLAVAEHGDFREADQGAAHRLAELLDERNRQVATLAEQARNIAIDDEPQAVVTSIVSAVRRVMRDPTWRCAVLTSDTPDLLRPGIYHGREEGWAVEPVGELERWASVAEGTHGRVDGPWGAFSVIHLTTTRSLRAILYAPWEGRAEPTAAEVDLRELVGQHAGTALEHSLLYATVRLQAAELDRLTSVQADFLRGVTHDLQTPLTSIGALATELGANQELPESARADLDSITHQADRLRRMVAQLLIASRLETGAYTPQQEVFGIEPLVERTWRALRSDRPFEMRVDGRPHLAIGDPDRVEQVLWAVLDNALKYSPPGSPIAVQIRPDGGGLSITVTDHGMGMDPVAAARAFEQFYRADRARSVAPDGSGVGLYAARGLVEAMSGTITIDSTLGRGTSVTVTLPAEASDSGGE